MEKNEIKKALYKVDPPAELMYVDKEKIFYRCSFDHEGNTYILGFSIPLGDIQDAKFHSVISAKLLIRWLQ